MLKRQVWVVDNDEFYHVVKNSQRVLKLNDQHENHSYVEGFTKEYSVMFIYGTYILEGEAKNESNFCRQMINCMRARNYTQKTSDLPRNTRIIKQTHKIMMDGAGEYRKSPVFAGYHNFASAGYIERYMEDAIFKFHETKKEEDPIMAATNLFGNIINIHSFEDGNGRICCLILAHVLIQMKCCLFSAILSSFHRRDRRHYIRVVKRYHENPSTLYTMIVKFLSHCWDNFEPNARMLT